jgi:RHS repeat-associated protein
MSDSYINLLWYGSRHYDPELGRFTSPDSIVPLASQGVQAYDRYGYVNNNPIRYNDPTGHYACSELWDECDGDLKFERLLKKATSINNKVGRKDSLEAMAQIAEKAASIYGNDWDNVLRALTYIYSGDPVYGSLTLKYVHDTEHGPLVEFGDKGFHRDFRDKGNQVYHVWGYIANSSAPGDSTTGIYLLIEATTINYVHEFDPRAVGNGGSWKDFILSEAGMYIGNQITTGAITPYELGDTLRQYLGPNTPPAFTSAGRSEYLWFENWWLP